MVKGILGFVAFVILIIFIIILFARGGNNSPQSTAPAPVLSSVAKTDSSFEFQESGPIIAEENHFNIHIKVSRWNREVKVTRGYQGEVVASQSFGNNESAYADFLVAIDRAGYTKQNRTGFDSEAGLCPLDNRYVFKSDQFNEDFRRWTTDCRERGDFGGDFAVISSLFRDQIPDYNRFIADTRNSTGLSL